MEIFEDENFLKHDEQLNSLTIEANQPISHDLIQFIPPPQESPTFPP